jgi:hypothetical protein
VAGLHIGIRGQSTGNNPLGQDKRRTVRKPSTRPQKVQVGAKVRVREDYRIPELRGMVGTVARAYGTGKRKAVHVASEEGLWQLFRPEELEELETESS